MVSVDVPSDDKHIRILVIDDDEFMLKACVHALRRIGYEHVLQANGGQAALDLLRAQTESIDVVLCDLNMPQMDGIEVLRALADQGYLGSVIVLSGEDARLIKAAAEMAAHHRLRVLGALQKPLKPAELEGLLQRNGEALAQLSELSQEDIDETALRAGIDLKELTVYFQPKVYIANRDVAGFEALSRWISPRYGLVSPERFVPLAENGGTIDLLTDYVIATAFREARTWQVPPNRYSLAVNVSMSNLNRLDLPEALAAQAQQAGLAPEQVVLEVTESRLMENPAAALDTLARLRLKRIGLSIDDFGTGYSSLDQLQRIPFTELKVDRLFVHGAAQNPTLRAIFESSVKLGKSLGLTIVAEGVETPEDWRLAEALGCDMAQGYLVSKPMPAAEVSTWLQRWALRQPF